MSTDLLFMFLPLAVGFALQFLFWRSISQMRRGVIRADNGRLIRRDSEPWLFAGYAAIWVLVFVVSLPLLFWGIAWIGYLTEYRK